MKIIDRLILELLSINKKSKDAQEKYKAEKAKYEERIRNVLKGKNINSYSFKNENYYYKATVVKQKKIEFNAEMIEQVIDKDLFNEICDKKYEIIDYEGMVKYLKSLGASPKVFKKFIHCEKSINKYKLDQLSELGDISLDDIEGCYTVSENSGYVRITESEEEITDE